MAITNFDRIITDGSGGFKEKLSGAPFRMNGCNLIKLAPDQTGNPRHSLFLPDFFDAYVDGWPSLRWQLRQMKLYGFNVVRVFIGFWKFDESIGVPDDGDIDGLNEQYLDRVAAFLAMANEEGMRVILVVDYWPQNDFYNNMAQEFPDDPWVINGGESFNTAHMSEVHLRTKRTYLRLFITNLFERISDAVKTTLFSYSLENEMHFRVDQYPFSTSSIVDVHGVSFDMDNTRQRQDAADYAASVYALKCSREIRAIDPDTMISTGFYSYYQLEIDGPDGLRPETHPSEMRRPANPEVMAKYESGVDFLDLHMYPDGINVYDIQASLDSMGFDPNEITWVLGEWGMFKSAFATSVQAALAGEAFLISLQGIQCGGWGFWSFDGDQANVWDLTDDQGAINYKISPAVNGDISLE